MNTSKAMIFTVMNTLLAAWVVTLVAQPLPSEPIDLQSSGQPEALSTAEIIEIFSDVRDDAQVQDSVGSSAVNYWYADGRFVSNWSNADRSGKVEGKWRAFDDERCVTIFKGLPDRIGKESCAPILRQGEKYLSTNPDGSVHGVHTVTPL